MTREQNLWLESPDHSAFVPIPEPQPTHSLHGHITGPPRRDPKQPMLVWITGAGGPAILYTALQQHLSRTLHIRCLFYDRAGYDHSTRNQAADKRTILATDSATDLWDLLAATRIHGSIILAAHSYGGIIAREFLQLVIDRGGNPSHHHHSTPEITGLLLFDCATELMLQLYPRIPSTDFQTISEGVPIEDLTNLIPESGLTPTEIEVIIQANRRTSSTLADEDTHASGRLLAAKHQLDRNVLTTTDAKLVVVGTNMAGDYRLMYDEGVKRGNGTAEERERAREFCETFALHQKQIGRAQLDLLGPADRARRRYVFLEDVGHDAPLRIKRRYYVGEQVRWILGR